jgi:DNA-directed RNA polymerase II subunit RPB2
MGYDYITPQERDVSVRPRDGEVGIVDYVVLTENEKHEKMAKVKTRQIRVPAIGDKFASRHGQKGTVGMIFAQENMPYSNIGTVPDVIINPHCMPARMTIGHMMECLAAKAGAAHGASLSEDGTSFREVNDKTYISQLRQGGCPGSCNEVMNNPYNGREMSSQICVGPVYYHRLRHMVADKIYARRRGLIEAQTRQPLHGRARNGGLRFGEM